ncbi:hypothetical protein BDV18DRAFT_156995 [Aspergillus unguis]
MKFSIWFLSSLISPILAETCNPLRGYYVSRQEELELIAQHCTQIDGFLSFLPNYTGPNSLRRATTRTTTTLRNLSFPKLENAPTLAFVFEAEVEEVKFPALKRAEYVQLEGNFSKVCNAWNCDEHWPAKTSMSVEFKSLKRAKALKIIGNVSSFSAPDLTSVASPGRYIQPALELGLYGEPLELDLPKLSHIEDHAEIKGNITSLSLPALRKYPPEFEVDSAVSLSLNLSVETAGDLSLNGEIERDALKETAKDVTVDDDNFECESTTTNDAVLYARPIVAIAVMLSLSFVL